MKLLFDTHTFIWWDSTPAKLPDNILALCDDPTNTLWLSVASAWEMQIKLHLGKLKLRISLAEIIIHHRQTNHVEVLPIALEHVLALNKLPDHHKDPFDRLLLAQAMAEEATLISNDPLIKKYSVSVIW